MGIENISRQIESDLGCSVRLEALPDPDFKAGIADATLKYRVHGDDGGLYFLLVADDVTAPSLRRAVSNIHDARARVSEASARHILAPVTSGLTDGQYYAMWSNKRPLPLRGRLRKFLACQRYAPKVLDWHIAVTVETLTAANPATFIDHLRQIETDERLPADMRADATLAIARVETGDCRPKHSLSHGDFWSGNILLPLASDEPSFYVIDWAGMEPSSAPFIDMTRMLLSSAYTSRFRSASLTKLRDTVGCETVDVTTHALSRLGQIGQNLEHYPEHRYLKMAQKVHRFIKDNL